MKEALDIAQDVKEDIKSSKRSRILQSTFARLRRQASKFAAKKNKIKAKRENEARAAGNEASLPKHKRNDSKKTNK